jgi:hypothetical protein
MAIYGDAQQYTADVVGLSRRPLRRAHEATGIHRFCR